MKKEHILFPILLFVLSSCFYDNEEELYGIECSLENVSYSTQIERIVSQSCATTNCHDGNSLQANYSSYESLLIDSGKIFDRVIIQKNMPPNAVLTDCDFNQFDQWLRNGANL